MAAWQSHLTELGAPGMHSMPSFIATNSGNLDRVLKEHLASRCIS